ncbi:MAG: hypothetical protein ACRDJU_02500 [Actinomycetota bacterium]
MSGYKVALFFHIVGVVTLFAAMGIQQVVGAQLRSAGSVRELRQWMQAIRPTGLALPLAAAVILISGFVMTAQQWTMSTPWIATGFVTLLAMAAIGATVLRSGFTKIGKASAAAMHDDGPIPAETARLRAAPQLWIGMGVMDGAAVGVLWLMTTKPGGALPVAVVLVAAAIGAALGALPGVRAKPRVPVPPAWAPNSGAGR